LKREKQRKKNKSKEEQKEGKRDNYSGRNRGVRDMEEGE